VAYSCVADHLVNHSKGSRLWIYPQEGCLCDKRPLLYKRWRGFLSSILQNQHQTMILAAHGYRGVEPAKKHVHASAISKDLPHIQLLTDSHKKPPCVMKRFPFYQRRPSFLEQGEQTCRFPTNLHGVDCSARPTTRWALFQQRRTAWWTRHSKDTANNHLLQTCLY